MLYCLKSSGSMPLILKVIRRIPATRVRGMITATLLALILLSEIYLLWKKHSLINKY